MFVAASVGHFVLVDEVRREREAAVLVVVLGAGRVEAGVKERRVGEVRVGIVGTFSPDVASGL